MLAVLGAGWRPPCWWRLRGAVRRGDAGVGYAQAPLLRELAGLPRRRRTGPPRVGARRRARLPGGPPGLRALEASGEGRSRRRGRPPAADQSVPRLHRAVDPRDQDAHRRGEPHGGRPARARGDQAQGGARPHRVLRGAGALLRALHLARADYAIRETALADAVRAACRRTHATSSSAASPRRSAGGRRDRVRGRHLALLHVGQVLPTRRSTAHSCVRFTVARRARARAPRAPCSRSPTTAAASPPPTCRACSSEASPARTAVRRARPPAWACTLPPLCEKMGLGVGDRLRGGHRHPRHDLLPPRPRRRTCERLVLAEGGKSQQCACFPAS